MAYDKDSQEPAIGSLWTKQNAAGKTYFTGEVLDQKIVVFANKSDNERAPQWKIFRSRKRDPEPRPTAPTPPADFDDDGFTL